MAVSKRNIFRGKAMQHYAASRQKEVLPRLISPPVFVFLWLLLALLLFASLAAWLTRVPTYVVTTGVVLDQGIIQGQQANDQATAIVFVPVSHALQVYIGQPILLQIGATGTQLHYKVERVVPGILSPNEARRRYGLDNATSPTITGPSIVLTISLGPAFPAQQYAGSPVSAQLQIGSQRVLSLLPGLGQWIGG
jgi:hypothetical protein